MMGRPRAIGNDPRRYTTPIKNRLRELASEMRADADKVDDAQAKALFETGAEVISGLMQSFEDYEAKNEAAWR